MKKVNILIFLIIILVLVVNIQRLNNRLLELELREESSHYREVETMMMLQEYERLVESYEELLELREELLELREELLELREELLELREELLELREELHNKMIGMEHLEMEEQWFEMEEQWFEMEATAYTDDVESQGKWVGQTASGMKPQVGVVAVDPKVIPLGTKLYVEGYGEAIAGDTGGAIKGMRIDVFLPDKDSCMKWGRRKVKVWKIE